MLRRYGLVLLLLSLLASCAHQDPFGQPGHMVDRLRCRQNDANLAGHGRQPRRICLRARARTTSLAAEAARPVQHCSTAIARRCRTQRPAGPSHRPAFAAGPGRERRWRSIMDAVIVAADTDYPSARRRETYRRMIVAFVSDDESARGPAARSSGFRPRPPCKWARLHQAIRFLEKSTLRHDHRRHRRHRRCAGSAGGPGAALSAGRAGRGHRHKTEIGFYRMLINELGVTEYMPKPLTRDSVQRFFCPISRRQAPCRAAVAVASSLCAARGVGLGQRLSPSLSRWNSRGRPRVTLRCSICICRTVPPASSWRPAGTGPAHRAGGSGSGGRAVPRTDGDSGRTKVAPAGRRRRVRRPVRHQRRRDAAVSSTCCGRNSTSSSSICRCRCRAR